MYEPKYLPQLTEIKSSLLNMRFAVIDNKKYIYRSGLNSDPLHIHNYLEIFINVSGDVSFLVNNTLYPVPIGDAVVSRSGDIHMGVFHKDAVHEHICIWIDTDFNDRLFSFLRQNDFCPLFSFERQQREKLRSLALALLEACVNNGSELEKISFLLQILTLFENKTGNCITKEAVPRNFQMVLDDIRDNFSEIHNIDNILKANFVSSATLTRWFRKYLNTSPRAYLEQVRLSEAAILLLNGYSVTEACMRVGFSDCSHFIVLFKNKFGETPLKYKKNHGSASSFQK